jgi:hypothetical protein
MKKEYCGGITLLALFMIMTTGSVQAGPPSSSGSTITAVVDSIPRSIAIQAFAEDGGVALSGTFSVTVGIYDSPTNGTLKYQENFPSVLVDGGLINLTVGANGFPPDIFDGLRYVQLTVGTTTLPRIQVHSVPYSFRSESQPAVAHDAISRFLPLLIDDPNEPEYIAKRVVRPYPGFPANPPEAAGFCFVMLTADIYVEHTVNEQDSIRIWLTDKAHLDPPSEFPETQDFFIEIESTLPSGIYRRPVTIHGVFECSAGQMTTYGAVGWDILGTGWIVEDTQFTVIFIPGEMAGDGVDPVTTDDLQPFLPIATGLDKDR